jgi:hypothetical protein
MGRKAPGEKCRGSSSAQQHQQTANGEKFRGSLWLDGIVSDNGGQRAVIDSNAVEPGKFYRVRIGVP